MDILNYHSTTKEFDYLEGKGSATARLSPNQSEAHPKIELKGSVVKGKGKPPFTGGVNAPSSWDFRLSSIWAEILSKSDSESLQPRVIQPPERDKLKPLV